MLALGVSVARANLEEQPASNVKSKALRRAVLLALVPSLIYLITRLWGITGFPLFFFSDEANNVIFGQKLLHNGLAASDGSILPMYFEWDIGRWAPVFPVYIHAVTSSIFGKSIAVARTTTSILSFIGVLAVAVLLRQIFRIRAWWSGISFLTIIPAWFLYTRTTFETVVGAAFFACFLLCYLLYRYRSAKWIYAAVAFGAGAFYSYSNQQLPLLFLSAVLYVSDYSYHRSNKIELLQAMVLACLLAIPFVQFQILHPGGTASHLKAIQSYIVEPIPLGEKIQLFAQNYLHGISPRYWFSPANGEVDRVPNQHYPGLGNLGWYLLPFILTGLVICAMNFRNSAYRTIIFSMLAVPMGAAVDSVHIPRMLAFVIPAAVMAALGLEQVYVNRGKIPEKYITYALQLIFSLAALGMLRTALIEGPNWGNESTPGLKEFAMKAVFEDRLPELLEAEPDTDFIISSSWANNVYLFPEFFIDKEDQNRVSIGHIQSYMYQRLELNEDMIFILPVEEFKVAEESGLFSNTEILDTVNYPQAGPAMYFARFAYAPNADQILYEMEMERQKLVDAFIVVDGVEYKVRHSRLAFGSVRELLDDNPDTLVRGESANPIQFEISSTEQMDVDQVKIMIAKLPDFTISVYDGTLDDSADPFYSKRFLNVQEDPVVVVNLDGEHARPTTISIEILFADGAGDAQIHVRDIVLQ
jgi:4-amino-4-deoxy-L-arabinose transferase-like glycosyltransferase